MKILLVNTFFLPKIDPNQSDYIPTYRDLELTGTRRLFKPKDN